MSAPSNYEVVNQLWLDYGELCPADCAYRFAAMTSNGLAVAGLGARVIGAFPSVPYFPTRGPRRDVPIGYSGRVLVTVGAAVGAGQAVASDANGYVTPLVEPLWLAGAACEAGIAGDIISVVLGAKGWVPSVSVWIMATGYWADDGVWIDADVWED